MCHECKESLPRNKAVSKNFKFKIASIWWSVFFVDSVMGGEALGICSYADFEIAIDRTQNHTQQRLTFWHEFSHLATRSCMSQDNVNVEHMADAFAECFIEAYPQILKKAPALLMDAKVDKVKKEVSK